MVEALRSEQGNLPPGNDPIIIDNPGGQGAEFKTVSHSSNSLGKTESVNKWIHEPCEPRTARERQGSTQEVNDF